jgi:hypothetical protein
MRHCLGQQPFKYFVETDPTVPKWVKTITEEDIENWNSVLNKQNSFSAGRALSFNGNTLDFDYYVNTGGSDNTRLLTKDNIEILCNFILRENIQDEFSRLMQYAINDEIKNFVNTKISALNINSFLPKLTFTNKMIDIENTLNNLQGVINETNISIGGKQDTLSVIGDGLVFKSPHDYDGSQQDTTNKILSLGLDIWDDAHSNEYYKDEYRTERGYNGDDFGNLVHFHYKDTDNKIYLAVPFSKRLMYEDVAISSKAILNELNLNYEMKLATLEGNVNFVDLDYYKNKWGVTGDNFTKDDYKTLLKEWYNIELDANDPNNQTLINLYSYDGHNDKYYGRQRAIVINLSEENEIHPAVEWVAIQNASEENFNARTVSWWYSDTIDGVKNFLSEDDEYPGNDKYYWMHGDISTKTKIPSVDAVAKYAARGLSITQGTTSNTFNINLLNYAETILDTINANLNFDSTNRKVQIKSGDTLLSEVQLTDWVTKDTEQTISGKKTFNEGKLQVTNILDMFGEPFFKSTADQEIFGHSGLYVVLNGTSNNPKYKKGDNGNVVDIALKSDIPSITGLQSQTLSNSVSFNGETYTTVEGLLTAIVTYLTNQ